jgi:ribonuclease HI
MWVTSYTDASWDQALRAGGWGAYLRSDDGLLERKGPLLAVDSYMAELVAIEQAVGAVLDAWPHTTGILVVSDCTGAIQALRNDRQPRRADARAVRRRVEAMRDGRHFRYRWVKGHAGGRTKQSWVNIRADELARQAASAHYKALRLG